MRETRSSCGRDLACMFADSVPAQLCPPSSSANGRRGAGETECSSTLRCVHIYHTLAPLALNSHYQDNAGVIVNPKGEMKGSAITGPVAKECVSSRNYLPSTSDADCSSVVCQADLWPRIASNAGTVV